MLAQTPTLNSHTPMLTVADSRGLPVRSVGYCRSAEDGPAEARINRTVHDLAGRAIAQWDPRLVKDASAPANLASVYSLSGKVLSTISVDAGLRVGLFGEADQRVHSWDGRGSQRRMVYDKLMRPQAVFEQAIDEEPFCSERYGYGSADPAFADHNQCGQLIRHDDPAGTQLFDEFGLTGALLEQTQHFSRALNSQDWPEDVLERNKLLEPGAGATTLSRFSPLGEVIEQTDAKGNRQFFSQTVDGLLREVRLQLKGDEAPKTLVSAIQYNAHGQTERETAGNGVVSTLQYRPEDGRLSRLQARRDGDTLQDLNYRYDPVGNVSSIEDAAQPTRYFANQRIDPISCYFYDSLYQLIKATGWEAGGANKGPQFSGFNDPAPRANYRQTCRYDKGGNLLELTHEGAQSHGRVLTAAQHSNRCLPEHNGRPPSEADIAAAFDANGNLLSLQPGQALSWDLRNQLKEVQPVERDSGVNDSERYIYGADGMRRRKVRLTQTNARTITAEVRYLPGLEIRTNTGTGEVLHVIVVQTGHSSVRVLHWQSDPPKDITNNQYRYNLMDHLGSCTLELDSAGEVISQECYHPFGSTAWFAGRGEVEASYKTVRYSGKERDATGLYYYGFRYYVPWWQRWINPDPAGKVDGFNLFRMARNNPTTFVDGNGLAPNRPIPSDEDKGYLDMFFDGAILREHIDVYEEMNKHGSGFNFFGKVLANPFRNSDRIPDSWEKLSVAGYKIKEGLVYRAHQDSPDQIEKVGLLRNSAMHSGSEDFDSYIASIFKHTAGTGSQGAILSLSTKRTIAKKFMNDEKTLATIDLKKLDPALADAFMTTPEVIAEYGGRMLRLGKIDALDLIKALDQLNNKEKEVFFIGQSDGLQIGEIPKEAISAVKRSKKRDH